MPGELVQIGGNTRFLVIIGDPVAQVRSPAVLNARFAARRCDRFMIPWRAPAHAFGQVMTGLMQTLNLDGIVVTYPFKERALALADSVAPRALQVGAINAMRRDADGRWSADMFDGVGLVRALGSAGQAVSGRPVKLLGAGGAGGAIAFALAEAGASRISIHDTDAARAAALASKVQAVAPTVQIISGGPELGGADILINATPVGLAASDPLPVPLPDLTSKTTVVDIVIREGGTRLFNHAQALGCPAIAGAAMVEGQAEELLRFFRIAAARGTEGGE